MRKITTMLAVSAAVVLGWTITQANDAQTGRAQAVRNSSDPETGVTYGQINIPTPLPGTSMLRPPAPGETFTATYTDTLQWFDPGSSSLPQLQMNGVIEGAELKALTSCYTKAGFASWRTLCAISDSKLTGCDKSQCTATATAVPIKMGFPSYTYQGQIWIDSRSNIGDFNNANALEVLGGEHEAQQNAIGTCRQTGNRYCVLGGTASVDRCDAGTAGLPGPNTATWRCRFTTTAIGWTYYPAAPAQGNTRKTK